MNSITVFSFLFLASREMTSDKVIVAYVALSVAVCFAAVFFLFPWFSWLLIKAFGYWTAFSVFLFIAMSVTYIFMVVPWLYVSGRINPKIFLLAFPTLALASFIFARNAAFALERIFNMDINDNVILLPISLFGMFVFCLYALRYRRLLIGEGATLAHRLLRKFKKYGYTQWDSRHMQQNK
ncbi:MAG: hypothetical protein QXJ03_04755 [Desulfurococcus sp.]